MKTLKQLLSYTIWIALALLLGMVYMRFVLGPNKIPKEGMGYLFHMFYSWGIVHVGLAIGATIALLFILLDVLYIKKQLKQYKKAIFLRVMILLLITIMVGVSHYILEKVIDVI
ncbi:hypothetical protein [Echinicola shivajiensis]|uniref:hypothetical protein n=1 Tax=Echinicola shivajiensis TaxID=1035916 RepID=UPI001BFC998E|nr:hypothetical protein [Echinicola shivajiensis]